VLKPKRGLHILHFHFFFATYLYTENMSQLPLNLEQFLPAKSLSVLDFLNVKIPLTSHNICTPPEADVTRTDSLVGRTSVIIADDAGLIPAQSTIFMTFLQFRRLLWVQLNTLP
jgi:hypothetical protein